VSVYLIRLDDEFLYKCGEPIPGGRPYNHRRVYKWLTEDGPRSLAPHQQHDNRDGTLNRVTVRNDVLAIRREGKFIGYTCLLCRAESSDEWLTLYMGDPRDHGWLCPAHEAEIRQAMEGM